MSTLLLASTGVTLGAQPLQAVDDFGCTWTVDSFDGWGSPTGTLAVQQRPRSAGGWASKQYLAPRRLSLVGYCLAPDPGRLRDGQERLSAAASLDDTLLTVLEAGLTRSLMVRRDGEVLWTYRSDTAAKWSIAVTALNPAKLGDPVTSPPCGLPITTGGLVYPLTYPVTYSDVTVSGSVSAFNAGNADMPCTVTFTGSVSDPLVTHIQSQSQVALDLDLSSGEFVTLDMARRQALAQGSVSRAGQVVQPAGWFLLPPGANELRFAAAAYDPAASMTVQTYTGSWL